MNFKLLMMGREPVSRGAYLGWGLGLAAVKFNLDRVVAAVFFDQHWSIFQWDTLRMYLWQSFPARTDPGWAMVMFVCAIPFLWLGVTLTLGRLRAAGLPPWWVLLFFVPAVKLVFFAVLAALPSGADRRASPGDRPGGWQQLGRLVPRSRSGSATMAVIVTAACAALATWAGTTWAGNYGWALFVGLPFVLGFTSALIYSFHELRGLGECLLVSGLAGLISGFVLLGFAIEGVLCLLMAMPLALGPLLVGAVVGWSIQETLHQRAQSGKLLCVALLAVPLSFGIERAAPPELPLIAVRSAVIVNAPPETVWKHVVEFSELPAPTEWIFRVGVAYPVRAEIAGRGVGAVRRCNFSTGPFVEPIEVWDEPRLLGFAVTQNPEPMQEWTPYHDLHPPHLDGYLESKRGQFRLESLPDGRTRLEGTTWYHHHLWPARYWQVWSDYIIHRIHLRVLNHVQRLAEADLVNVSRP